jgi:hypothetical protein
MLAILDISKMKFPRIFPGLAFGILISMGASAGTIVVEDFEDGAVGAFDPFINYSFRNPAEVRARLLTDFFSPPGYLLFLSGNTTGILTFNTQPYQSIASASLEYADYSGGGAATVVEFVGKLGVQGFTIKNSGPVPISTAGLDLGPITEIRLHGSLESSFDNIVLEVVPEPGALPLILVLLSSAGLCRNTGRRRGRSPQHEFAHPSWFFISLLGAHRMSRRIPGSQP